METLATVVTAWVAVLTAVVTAISFIFRHWLKSYIGKYDQALYEAQSQIDILSKRLLTMKAYAAGLRDAMVAAGMNPEKPPTEFYD